MRLRLGIGRWFLAAVLGAAAVMGVGALVASGDDAPSRPTGVRDPADTGNRGFPMVPQTTAAGEAADEAAMRGQGAWYVENGVRKKAFISVLPELDPSAERVVDDPKNRGKAIHMVVGPNGKLVVTGIEGDSSATVNP